MLISMLALTMAGAQAAPAADPTVMDLRCLAAAGALTNVPEADAETKQSGVLLATYYLGRLDGRVPDLDVEKGLNEQIPALKDADLEALLKSCAALAHERASKLETMGQGSSPAGE
jgi:hypothetical protein